MAELSDDVTRNDDEYARFVPPFGGLTIAVERCPLCFMTRKPFTCQKCVEKGNFTHSNGRNPERYAEKLQRLNRLRKERLKLYEKLSTKLQHSAAIAEKKWEMSLMKDRIQWAEQAVEENIASRSTDEEKLRELKERIKRDEYRAKVHRQKVDKIQKYIDQSKNSISSRRESLDNKEEKLCELRKSRIQDLITYIFPVSEIVKSDPQQQSEAAADVDEDDELVAALIAEARRTAYVRGRWVYTENSHEVQYSVVHSEVCLPANGDYSSYTTLVTHEEGPRAPDTELDLHNAGHQMSGALCYTTQMVSLIAYYLGIVLPKRLQYSTFCIKETLGPGEFSRAVEKLNINVLYLCFSQNVDVENLHPHYTLRNLLTLVSPDNSDLGRTQHFDVHCDLLDSVHTPGILPSESDTNDDSDSLLEDDSDGSAEQEEWETVQAALVPSIPSIPSQLEPQSDSPDTSALTPEPWESGDSQGTMGASTASHVGGGLMSSAAASVMSLWRTATSQVDKR
ncbi:beclin 1-associated autophagy-related key regulator-like [Amphiura filiformis]|uniref:beclin 1-associated autophagy-related key regulator-like n=1 Tax=Amphiura filiformis TaxID=82378 RepID=UPI003B20CFAD